jgi:hypothetical protein
VTVRYRGQNPACKLFGKQDGALRLTAGAEIPCPATERQKMLLVTFCASALSRNSPGLLGKSSPLHEIGFFSIIANLARAKLVQAIWGTDLNGRYGIWGQMTQYWRAPTIPHAFGVDDVAHNRILSGDYFIRA